MSRTRFIVVSIGALSMLAGRAEAGPRNVLDGPVRLWFEGPGGPRSANVPVAIELAAPPRVGDMDALRTLGVSIATRRDGSPRGRGRVVVGEAPQAALLALATAPWVARVSLDGPLVAAPPPLDVTAAEIQATDAWRTRASDDAPLTGAGLTLCDVDSGIDVFHPLFFRADGPYRPWVDADGDGVFTPGVDGIEIDGQRVVLRVLGSVVTSAFGTKPLFDSDDPGLAAGMDWLYADTNGSGLREYGPGAGFTEADAAYGEPLFVVDDVDGDAHLDPGERLVQLVTSKIRAVRIGKDVYRRGENLIAAPVEPSASHGTGASTVLVGGNRGLTRLVGIAPDAELVVAHELVTGQELLMTDFCIEEGARVVLHEYAPWQGFHLDGSSPLEKFIDETSAEGIVHVNPAGNLSGAQKAYAHAIAPGEELSIPIEVPLFQREAMHFFGLSILWRDPSRDLGMTLEDATGFSLPVTSAKKYFHGPWHDGLDLWATRTDSARGTARVDVYVSSPSKAKVQAPLDVGTWTLRVTDPTPPGARDLEILGFVMDDLSGWSKGIHFPDSPSEDHLIGWPGTADHGLAVAASTGHGFFGGEPGTRAHYSGRGHRIDGASILFITAPDDPITAGVREGSPAADIVFGGTSGASPHVAGAAALLIQADPARSGDDVKEALRAGALVDEAVGAAPNDDWGHGKLRVYESLYGQPPPGGSPPIIAVDPVTVRPGETAELPIRVSDADELSADLRVEIDRDYDGAIDEVLAERVVRAAFDAEGLYAMRLTVTDATGREASALALIEVKERATLEAAGGCRAARADPDATWPSVALVSAAGALARWRRRRRAPTPARASSPAGWTGSGGARRP